MTLYTEIVERTFTGGTLKGITIQQEIPRVTNPRPIGAVQHVTPIGRHMSPYRDEVIGWACPGEPA
jgi:hypothetical protein